MPLLTRKTLIVEGWHLVDLAAMAEAFTALTAEGWRGGISSDQSGNFVLELNADNPSRHIRASVGDWLVLDMGLRLMTEAEFTENYEVQS